MYWKFCLRRIFYGIMIFIVILFIYSILFDTVMIKTVKSQIEEELKSEQLRMNAPGTSVVDLQKYLQQRREQRYILYKLDKPRWYRITSRTLNLLALNFGKSTHMRSSAGDNDVWNIIKEVIPRTVILFTTAILLDIVLGLILGIIKARKAGSFLDRGSSLATLIVYGMPSWWLGMLFIIFFAYTFKIFPSGGFSSSPPAQGFGAVLDIGYHMILPVITLVSIGFWGTAFIIRNIVLGVLQEDFVMAARARGIPERKVLFGHALRTAAPPITTMSLLMLLASIDGNIIFEGIFSWPGLGNLYWIAIEQNDIPVLLGSLFITTGLYITGLVVLDLIYGFLDPRIKVGGTS